MPKSKNKRKKVAKFSLPKLAKTDTFKVLSGAGVRMAYSESIMKYDQHRDKSQPFFLGDWLKTLSEKALQSIKVDAHAIAFEAEQLGTSATEHGRDDAVNTAIAAYSLETANWAVDIDPEKVLSWVTSLAMAASLTTLSRKGLVELHAPLSIQEDQSLQVSLTDKSVNFYEAFKAGVH